MLVASSPPFNYSILAFLYREKRRLVIHQGTVGLKRIHSRTHARSPENVDLGLDPAGQQHSPLGSAAEEGQTLFLLVSGLHLFFVFVLFTALSRRERFEEKL